ncbi:MAG: SRPBCC family protein [Bacillota bacterium]
MDPTARWGSRSEETSIRTLAFTGLSCVAMGAGLMYMLDPARGALRRGMVRDKLIRASKDTAAGLRKTAEYSRNRLWGIAAETRAKLTPDHADDQTISARVRSAMGRAVSHPSAIKVAVRDGMVALRGPILADEVDRLLRTVSQVRGVRDVENYLDVHKQAGDNPALQGGAGRVGRRYGVMQDYWSPLARLLAGGIGGVAAGWGVAKRGLPGLLVGATGAGLFLRALTNLSLKRLTGIAAGPRAVDVQKTITINAPLEEVFGFFSKYENFPRFMSNVREVRDYLSGRSHWVIAGPAGMQVSWDADLTQLIPNEVIAWRSVPGSTVENSGVIRFQPEAGGTRVDIKLSYNPPGGALGHAMARLFGADPKSEFDADLARVKTMLETGQPARDAAQPIRT